MTFTVRIVFPRRPPQEATLRLYQDNTWKAIPGVQFSENTATYSVEDGSPLDADGRQNGQVVNTVALLVPATSPAPATWMRTYGTPEVDQTTDATPTADGGYLITAYWYNVGSGAPAKPYLLKVNAEGRLEWSKFADIEFFPEKVVAAPDGGYLIAGTQEVDGISTRVVLLKVDDRGNRVWQKLYGLPQTREVRDLFLFPTPDAGYALLGTVTVDEAEGSWNWNTWLMKLDAQGNLLWQKGLAREGFETDLTAVKAVRDGYILAGSHRSWSLDSYHLMVVKLGPEGQILWKKMFSEPPSDCGVGVDIEGTPDGGYVVLGSCWVPDSQRMLREDVFLMRLDGEGNLLWSKRYGGESNDRGYDLLVTPDGGYLVVGRTQIAPGGAWLLKLDPQGNVEWERTYRGSNTTIHDEDEFYRIFAVDGGYVVVGYTDKLSSWVGSGYNSGDIWILKVDAQGRVANCDASVVQGNGGSWVREVPLQGLDPNDPTYNRWIAFDPGFTPQPLSLSLQEGFMSEMGTQCGR
ncbi:choice-of-anchor U domain-containing protein [Thermus sp.]|uniref:choice-of-anchor U domain-containing protein n=1 Tax=Thermus sp. TaxID=275 RepID=UPI003D12172B